MSLYYEPKSYAPILQDGLRQQAAALSQPMGLGAAAPGIAQLGVAGLDAAKKREEKMSLLAAQQAYSNYMTKAEAGTATPADHQSGVQAALSLGITPPSGGVDPRLMSIYQKDLGLTGPISGTKENAAVAAAQSRQLGENRTKREAAIADAKKTAADRKLSDATLSNGKRLPAPTVLTMNDGKNVARLLPEVAEAITQNAGIFGPAEGRARSLNPYDKTAQAVDARLRSASQAFGKFMEGGVLRKEDEEKYRKMFPQLSDTAETAQTKLSIVQRQLAQKYNDDKLTMGKSGYDVSGFIDLEIPASVFTNKPSGAGKAEYDSLYEQAKL